MYLLNVYKETSSIVYIPERLNPNDLLGNRKDGMYFTLSDVIQPPKVAPCTRAHPQRHIDIQHLHGSPLCHCDKQQERSITSPPYKDILPIT